MLWQREFLPLNWDLLRKEMPLFSSVLILKNTQVAAPSLLKSRENKPKFHAKAAS